MEGAARSSACLAAVITRFPRAIEERRGGDNTSFITGSQVDTQYTYTHKWTEEGALLQEVVGEGGNVDREAAGGRAGTSALQLQVKLTI